MSVVSASSLLSNSSSTPSHYLPSTVDKADNLHYDLGNLMCFDSNPLDEDIKQEESNTDKFNSYLHALGRENSQLLLNHIFALPTRTLQSESGRIADLPIPSTLLPREKPVPKPKEPTKWEKFAKLKGIEKHKKSRMVYDEDFEAYKPRFGYNRANNPGENVIIEHKEGDDPSTDPWTKLNQEKKERVDKNKKQQLKNLKSAKGTRLPGTIDLASAISQSTKPTRSNKQAEKSEQQNNRLNHVSMALKLAQKSTASMGKFDSVRTGEKRIKEKTEESVVNTHVDIKQEKNRSLSVLNKLLGKSETDSERFNLDKAAGVGQREKEYKNIQNKNSNSNKGGYKRKRD